MPDKYLTIRFTPEILEGDQSDHEGLFGRIMVTEDVLADSERFERACHFEVQALLRDLADYMSGKLTVSEWTPQETVDASVAWRAGLQEQIREAFLSEVSA